LKAGLLAGDEAGPVRQRVLQAFRQIRVVHHGAHVGLAGDRHLDAADDGVRTRGLDGQAEVVQRRDEHVVVEDLRDAEALMQDLAHLAHESLRQPAVVTHRELPVQADARLNVEEEVRKFVRGVGAVGFQAGDDRVMHVVGRPEFEPDAAEEFLRLALREAAVAEVALVVRI